MVLPDVGSMCCIELAASGQTVLIAYHLATEQIMTVARVSTDGGSTFGPRRRLIRGGCAGCDGGTAPMSADVIGTRLVVHADSSGIGGGETYRFESTDDGASWTKAADTIDSPWMGAFTIRGGEVSLVESWGEGGFHSPPDGRRLWFHREQ